MSPENVKKKQINKLHNKCSQEIGFEFNKNQGTAENMKYAGIVQATAV